MLYMPLRFVVPALSLLLSSLHIACLCQLLGDAFIIIIGCPGSSIGIPTRYGVNVQGIEYRWRRDFPHPSKLTLTPIEHPVQWTSGISWG